MYTCKYELKNHATNIIKFYRRTPFALFLWLLSENSQNSGRTMRGPDPGRWTWRAGKKWRTWQPRTYKWQHSTCLAMKQARTTGRWTPASSWGRRKWMQPWLNLRETRMWTHEPFRVSFAIIFSNVADAALNGGALAVSTEDSTMILGRGVIESKVLVPMVMH